MCGPLDFICQGIAGGVEGAWQTVTMFLFGWLYAVPWWGWFLAGYLVGGVLAAMFGWAAVLLPGLGIIFGLLSRNAGTTSQQQPPPREPWEEPEPSRPPRRKSFADFLDDIKSRWSR